VTERYKYDAYGKQTITSAVGAVRTKSAVVFNRGFTGYIADSESGLLHARIRQYSFALGRFVGRDPTGHPDGFNRYGAYYVPNRSDPMGLAAENCFEFSRRPIHLDKAFGKQIGWFFVQAQFVAQGELIVQVCPKCCSDGRQVEEKKISLKATGKVVIAGGGGLNLSGHFAGDHYFGYAGVKLSGSISSALEGGNVDDPCSNKGSGYAEFNGGWKAELTGGFKLDYDVWGGWYSGSVGAEIYGNVYGKAKVGVKFDESGVTGYSKSEITDPHGSYGLRFCLVGCFDIQLGSF